MYGMSGRGHFPKVHKLERWGLLGVTKILAVSQVRIHLINLVCWIYARLLWFCNNLNLS